LNIQTERLDNHTARFTVTVDAARLEQAKQTAARKLAQRVNIPGFRKGKAPYRIIQQYFGDATILEDAIELLGNDLYKKALDESDIDPYGAGQLEDFKIEPEPALTFVVPLQPTVDLGDYRSTRMEYSVPEVEDVQVDRAMRRLLEDYALVEESHQPVALGNRVTMELYAKTIEESGESESSESDEESASPAEHDEEHDHDHGDEHDHDHDHGLGGNEFIHEHQAVFSFDPEAEQPVPGFREALIGAAVDEERVFELTYPDDEKEYEELAGKHARFKAVVRKIEVVTLPAMNDDFAARVTEKEEKQLTLLDLRMRMRENLQQAIERNEKSRFATEVLDQLVERATIAYPEEMIDDQSERYLERLDQDFRRQGLTLDDYMKIANKDREALKLEYHDIAVRTVKRSLVLREVMRAESVGVSDEMIDTELDRMLSQFGEQSAAMRPYFDTPDMRGNIREDLLQQGVMDRIVAIARGEAPEISSSESSVSDETPSDTDESANQGETSA
jgi:trigger factor